MILGPLVGCFFLGCGVQAGQENQKSSPITDDIPSQDLSIYETPAPAPATPTPVAVPYKDWRVPFSEERTRLTLEYRKQHQGYTGDSIDIIPKVVVLHWTGGSTASSAWNTFAPTRAADARPDLAAQGAVNVGTHFLVDRDGTIFRLIPENIFARHCIGLNHVAIGVENVGTGDLQTTGGLTQAQVEANIRLVSYLASVWPIEKVIGHLEYRKLEGTPFFLEVDPKYRTGKADPGAQFMAAVRAGLGEPLATPGW